MCSISSVLSTDSIPMVECNSSEYSLKYADEFFHQFAGAYEPIHFPLSMLICIFGILANLMNIIVLTRPSMATPTNVLMTGLSSAQLFLLINYLLLLTFNVCARLCLIPALHSYWAMIYKWINVNLSVAFHTIALIHTLFLAIFRFLAVRTPAFSRSTITISTARICVLLSYLLVPVLCSPTFFTSRVVKIESNQTSFGSNCNLEEYFDLNYVDRSGLLAGTMWTYGIVFKLAPSLAICILSFFLIHSLRRYEKKKARLTGKLAQQFEKHEYRPLLTPALGVLLNARPSAPPNAPQQHQPDQTVSQIDVHVLISSLNSNSNSPVKKGNKCNKQRNGLTKMLVAVALLCACVELPHGILNLLTAIFGHNFGLQVYDNVGDFFEMLTLLYSSVNFVLYCIMSTEFQREFRLLFFKPIQQAVLRMINRKN